MAKAKMSEVKCKAPLTCGEFVQGTINGGDFLVSCPISIYTTVRLKTTSATKPVCEINIRKRNEKGEASQTNKIREAVQRASQTLNIQGQKIFLDINCPLPESKGFATSSADIYGSLMALAYLFDIEVSPKWLVKIATEVEASDSNFSPGLWRIDHITGSHVEYLGPSPSGKIFVVDIGGRVHTNEFNQMNDLAALNKSKTPAVAMAYQLVLKGIFKGDIELLAKGATQSALAHQSIHYKAGLFEALEYFKPYGALGVVIAHSGTAVGFILEDNRERNKYFYEHYFKYPYGTFVGEFDLDGNGVSAVEA